MILISENGHNYTAKISAPMCKTYSVTEKSRSVVWSTEIILATMIKLMKDEKVEEMDELVKTFSWAALSASHSAWNKWTFLVKDERCECR